MTGAFQKPYTGPVVTALAVALAPHVFSLSLWITAWCALSWVYMVCAVKRGWPTPNRPVRILLTIIGLLAVLKTHRMLGGEFYLGLLAVMAGLKPMEMKSHRDRMVTVFLAYFIVITSLFQSETLTITVYMFISVTVSTAVLRHINHPGDSLRRNLEHAGRIMIQATPLMIALFFLFPRAQGSLWGIMDARAGRTGFSESFNLGDVADLVQDNRLAFRAEFKDGAAVPPGALYWRGIVYQRFNGRGWDPVMRDAPRTISLTGDARVDYVVTMEPHFQRWVFVLDMPGYVEGGAGVRIRSDHTVRSRRPLVRKERFHAWSYLRYATGPLDDWETAAFLMLPQGNPQTIRLAGKWRREGLNPDRMIGEALAFFRDNGFVYTLQPPLLDGHVIDMFLFETRRGYCEHFASAFVYLMRAAGVPARVVGGYLGGQVNPYGNFLMVRQADAHAWAEVWLEDYGWIRVDPTSVVAPGRIEQGVAGAVAAEEVPAFLNIHRFGKVSEYLWKARYAWEALNTRWDIWFSGYSYVEQRALLARMGIRTMNWFAQMKVLAMGTGFILVLAMMVFVRQFLRADRPRNPLKETYDRFCEKLAVVGLARGPAEGPWDYARRISEIRPDLTGSVVGITTIYVRMRYGRAGGKETLRNLRTMVKRFQPKKT